MQCKRSIRRNRILLDSAEQRLAHATVVKALTSADLEPISDKQWNLWVTYYAPLTADNPLYREELIYNNRPLAWFVRHLLNRRTKTMIS